MKKRLQTPVGQQRVEQWDSRGRRWVKVGLNPRGDKEHCVFGRAEGQQGWIVGYLQRHGLHLISINE